MNQLALRTALLHLLQSIIGKIFAIAIGTYYFKCLTRAYKVIFFQVIIAITAETFGYYWASAGHYNTWVFNMYLLLELLLTSYAGMLLIPNRTINKYLSIAVGMIIAIWCFQVSKFSIYSMATWALVCTSVILILIYFIVLFYLGYYTKDKLFRQPSFWLSISVILFFGGMLPVFGLQNYIYDHYPDLASKFWNYINGTLNFIRYPLAGLSFYLCGEQQKKIAKYATQ